MNYNGQYQTQEVGGGGATAAVGLLVILLIGGIAYAAYRVAKTFIAIFKKKDGNAGVVQGQDETTAEYVQQRINAIEPL